MSKYRCDWTKNDNLMIDYHDTEWGVPLHNDKKLFEFLTLDAFQAGLSWQIILHKRENFRRAFDDFDYEKIAKYDDKKIDDLMKDLSIIRNRLKIQATINNAKRYIEIQQEYGSFDKYIWQFSNYETIINRFNKMAEIPTKTELSDKMSENLKKRRFKFVGSTICYAFMQSIGMINDHLTTCFRYEQINNLI